jgi:peptide/nickel transport system substrate-binding protein
MKRKLWTVVAALVVISLLATACGAAPEPEVVEVEKVVTQVVEKEVEKIVTEVVEVEKEVEKIVEVTAVPAMRVDELDVGQLGNPEALSCPDWGSVDELDILHHFAEPLFRFNRDGTISGIVAEAWEMVSPTEWNIKIREGMKFHDPAYGELTAEDVVASLEWCFHPEKRNISRQPGVVADMDVEIVDDYNITVRFPEPGTAAVPNVWTYVGISDKDYLAEVGDDFTNRLMGTGPYKFVEWTPDVEIVGERFEDYWGEDPGVERLVWRVIPDAFTRKSEFMTGGLDILPFMVAEWVPEAATNADVRVEPILSARYIMVILPVGVPPYDDIRVRHALNYAVNKDEIVEQLFAGIGATPPRGVVNPILVEGDATRELYPYDPERAQQLLDEARADGVEIPPLTLYAPNDRYVMDKEMGEAVAGYWRNIGLEVEYIPESRSTLFPRALGLEMTDPFLIGFGNTLLRADYPFNIWLQKRADPPSRGSAYALGPDEWDVMISELNATESGSPESIELARELDELYIEYAPWVFVVNFVDLFGVSNDIEWKPYPFESRYFVDVKPR